MTSKFIAITTIAILAIIVATTTTATNVTVKASSNNNDNNCAEKSLLAEIVCNGQEALTGYKQGTSDGKEAAANGESNECPQSDGLSGYCLGFRTGWNEVSNAQETMDEVNNNNNNNNNDDNDDNSNGNREDDGEFVPKRVIPQSDVPKRIIGDNN